jgi:transcriptional regulator with XRE-family HTH domain
MKTKPKAGKMDKFIGKQLKQYRLDACLSQADLASVADMTFQQVQKYENGHDRVSASTLHKFACYLDVPMERFFPE